MGESHQHCWISLRESSYCLVWQQASVMNSQETSKSAVIQNVYAPWGDAILNSGDLSWIPVFPTSHNQIDHITVFIRMIHFCKCTCSAVPCYLFILHPSGTLFSPSVMQLQLVIVLVINCISHLLSEFPLCTQPYGLLSCPEQILTLSKSDQLQ